MLKTEVHRARRAHTKELLVYTEEGDVLPLKVDRDESLAHFKKRLEDIVRVPLEQSTLDFGSMSISLSESVTTQDMTAEDRSDALPSPQMRARGGVLREVPHGAAVLLKQESLELRHRRSLSSPNLSLADAAMSSDLGDVTFVGAPSGDGATPRPREEPKLSIDLLGSGGPCAPLRRMARDIRGGISAGVPPQVVSDGLGGCYVFRDARGRSVAIVKPTDEEPLAPNNPKGFVGRSMGDPGLKPSVRVGEGALRETAAFLLDHHGFARVPCTSLAKVTHPCFHKAESSASKPPSPFSFSPIPPFEADQASDLRDGREGREGREGERGKERGRERAHTKLVSIQEYVEHEDDASDVGTGAFTVDAVHRIGILDIRLFNTDRHSGNILVCREPPTKQKRAPSTPPSQASQGGGYGGGGGGEGSSSRDPRESVKLIPIDHGFCLPETLETAYFEWLHWPQASRPFSEESLAYIRRLDVAKDVALLQRELPMLRRQCLRTLEVSTTLLKACALDGGLTLAEIGQIMSRPLSEMEDVPSELERLCVLAKEEVLFACSLSRRNSAHLSPHHAQRMQHMMMMHAGHMQGAGMVGPGGIGLDGLTSACIDEGETMSDGSDKSEGSVDEPREGMGGYALTPDEAARALAHAHAHAHAHAPSGACLAAGVAPPLAPLVGGGSGLGAEDGMHDGVIFEMDDIASPHTPTWQHGAGSSSMMLGAVGVGGSFADSQSSAVSSPHSTASHASLSLSGGGSSQRASPTAAMMVGSPVLLGPGGVPMSLTRSEGIDIDVKRRHSSVRAMEPPQHMATSVFLGRTRGPGGHRGAMGRFANKRSEMLAGDGGSNYKPAACKPLAFDMPTHPDLFAGMDAEMWAHFLDVLRSEVQDALEDQRWRHTSQDCKKKTLSGFVGPSSCPDF